MITTDPAVLASLEDKKPATDALGDAADASGGSYQGLSLNPVTGVSSPARPPSSNPAPPEIDTTGHVPAGSDIGIKIPGSPDDPTAALGGQPPIHAQMAQSIYAALGGSTGAPFDWAKGMVSGALAPLANLSGDSGVKGLGLVAKARQDRSDQQQQQQRDQANKDRQAQLEERRVNIEQQRANSEDKERTTEAGYKMAAEVREEQTQGLRMKLLQHDIDKLPQDDQIQAMKVQEAALNFYDRKQQAQEADAIVGYKRAQIAGKDTPEFDNTPEGQAQANQYIKDNGAALLENGYHLSTRHDIGTGKMSIVDAPDSLDPKWFGAKTDADGHPVFEKGVAVPDGSIKGPDGKPVAMFGTPTVVHKAITDSQNIEEKNTVILKNNQEIAASKQKVEDDAEAGSALGKLGPDGDVSKLNPAERKSLFKYALEMSTNLNASIKAAHDAGNDALVADLIQQTLPIHKIANSLMGVSSAARQETAATPLPPAVQKFQDAQQASADAEAKKAADEQKSINERGAAPRQIPMGRGMGMNPDFNAAEQYIADHKELTGQERAQIRASYQRSAQPAAPTQQNVPPRPAGAPANYIYSPTGPHGAGYYDPALLQQK